VAAVVDLTELYEASYGRIVTQLYALCGDLTTAEDAGVLGVSNAIADGPRTLGTLDVRLGDLDGDDRTDLVMSQGEAEGYEDECVYLASEVVPPDSAPPVIRAALMGELVLARVHDNRTPNMPRDWRTVVVRSPAGDQPMTWYGENLFRGPAPASGEAQVCATDRAGNEACASVS
jgi:hypothetical protein